MKRTRCRYQPKRKKGWGLIVFILIAAGIIFCMGKAGLPESWEKEQLLPQLKQAEEVMARVFGQEEEEKPDETSGIRQDPSEDMPWLAAEFLENALPETLRQGRPFEEENSVAASAQEAPGAGEEEKAAEENGQAQEPAQEAAAASVSGDNVLVSEPVEGAVLIYHTHSTESYEPYSDGNYHVLQEEGTVRDVGNVLESALKEKGITVYHDKTLHDSPSYNNSYSRSLQTLKNQLAAREDIVLVVDLHRDAASAGKKYDTTKVNGKTASSFHIVVGNKNENAGALMDFANQVIETANRLYPGLGGKIIQREYKFNGYLSDHSLLLEVGNNLNTIEEVRETGRALGDVLAEVMKSF